MQQLLSRRIEPSGEERKSTFPFLQIAEMIKRLQVAFDSLQVVSVRIISSGIVSGPAVASEPIDNGAAVGAPHSGWHPPDSFCCDAKPGENRVGWRKKRHGREGEEKDEG